MKKILYIQHATGLGWSVVALLRLIKKLDRTRFTPMVACVGAVQAVPEFCKNNGFDAFACPEISNFPLVGRLWYESCAD